jgi:16S rRNA processing protein RimM
MEWDPEFLTIAHIVRPRGVKGEVVAEVVTNRPERFAAVTRVRLEASDGRWVESRLERYWFHRGQVILKFEGCETIETASQFRGWWVKVARHEAIPRDDDEYFLFELIGCEVRTESDQRVGRVRDVMETGDVPLLVVEGEEGEEVLIPFARALCPVVDVSARRIIVNPPEGLLDLNRERPSASERRTTV